MLTDKKREKVSSPFCFTTEDLAEAFVRGVERCLVNKYSSFPVPSGHPTRDIKEHRYF